MTTVPESAATKPDATTPQGAVASGSVGCVTA